MNRDRERTKDRRDKPAVREEQAVRAKECPWCGCSRSTSQDVEGFCNTSCRTSYAHYTKLYAATERVRGR